MLSGRLYNNMLRQELYVKTFVSSAQLLALFSTPVVIVTGQPGIFYIPRTLHLVKEAGTAYTLNAATNFGLFWSTGGTAAITVAPAGFLDQAGQLTSFAEGPGSQLTSLYTGFAPSLITNINGSHLQLTNNIANLTVGTGGVTVTVVYEQWPMVVPFS